MASDAKPGAKLLDILLVNSTTVGPGDETPEPSDSIPVLSNFEEMPGKDPASNKKKPKHQGLTAEQISDDLYSLTNGWPKRSGDILFCQGDDYKPLYLYTPTQFFAWVDSLMLVDWRQASDCITQERFFAYLQMSAEDYDEVVPVPHFPPLPRTYYMHPPLPETDGSYLEGLLNFFTPQTSIDRDLIKALASTVLWGGSPGKRPAFLITGPVDDPDPEKKGRGVGKTTVASLVSELVGGMMEFSAREDIADIKKRLLSPAGRPLRVGILDNLKTLRFSWAEFEGLITSPVISGHRMYKGEGRRPNNLVWVITLNGATLSKDMASRCIIIKLNRPVYHPEWQQNVESYIQNYRWEILNDIRLSITSN